MFNANTDYARIHVPRPDFPGDYTIDASFIGNNGNPTPYLGKIYILVNEVTISQAEYSAMMLGQSPCASATKIIGSSTSGADGDVCSFHFPGDFGFAFSGLGIFYPDSTVTQRVGIVPDTVVIPTPAGIRDGIDEVLMAAFDCLTAMNDNRDNELTFNVYPNPSDGSVNIKLANSGYDDLKISVFDLFGRNIFESVFKKTGELFMHSLDLSSLSKGIYLLKIESKNLSHSEKLVLR